MRELDRTVRWLRVSYWAGAIADAVACVAMFLPELGRTFYGVTDFGAGADFRYAMRLGGALMLGWTVLLLWADRKPVERRGVLPITVLVIAGLAWAGLYAVNAGLIPAANMLRTWVVQVLLMVLFLSSYFRASRLRESEGSGDGKATLSEAANRFLGQNRFAVAGVSRSGDAPANLIYKRLRDSGRVTYAINPATTMIGGDRCYARLDDLPQPPDAVVIATHPDQALDVAKQCKDANVPYVWFHRSIDGGSFSEEAAQLCTDYGASVIPGSCPMMHLEPVDFGHRCMRGILGIAGRLPSGVTVPLSGRQGSSSDSA